MKILVTVKRVIDANVSARPNSDGTAVELNNVKMAMNPFDEIAVEEAVRLREAGIASEVVVVSMGDDTCQESIRAALAIEADRGIHIKTDQTLQPLAVARLLSKLAEQEQPKIIISGKQAIDDDANQTGQMAAAMLSWPQATFASKIEVDGDTVIVTREIDAGLERLQLQLPAVITTDLRLNEPRYATLPNIMKSKKKPLDVIEADSFGVDTFPRLSIRKVEAPPERTGGVEVGSVAELVDVLRNTAKVLS